MSIDYNAGLIRDLAFCRARIRELEAAVAERDEAVKVLGKAFYGMWGELKDHDATTQTLEDIDTALTNPIARAAVDAAKGGTK